MRSTPTREAGFTLTELMVVIAIIAVLAAVAIPLFNRDTAAKRYDEMLNTFSQEIQRAKFEALSSKEDRSLMFNSRTSYRLVTMTVGDTSGTYAQLRSVTLPPDTEISGFTIGANTVPGTTPASVPSSSNEVEIRFTAISDIEVRGGSLGNCGGVDCSAALCPCSVTIYTQRVAPGTTAADLPRHRYVLHRGTAYAERFEGW